MKSSTLRNGNHLNSKLAAYSATAAAALLAAPTAEATVYDLTMTSVNNSGFSPTPFSWAIPHGANEANGYTTWIEKYLPHTYKFPPKAVEGATVNDDKIFKANFNVTLGNDHPIIEVSASGNNHFLHTSLSNFNLLKGEPLAGLDGKSQAYLAGRNGSGQFLPQGANAFKTGYLGFKEVNGGTYYGWLHIKIANDGYGHLDSISLIDNDGNGIFGALDNKNDLAADGFGVGSIAPESTPEPSTTTLGGLGLMALGATGVREMRRRQKAEKAS